LRNVLKTAGDIPLKAISKNHIVQGRERRAKTPAAARNFLETMRGFFAWALEMELVKTNPTEGVKAFRPKTDGFPMWTQNDIETFKARWPIGTRERVAFDLIRFTGLRRGDACRLGKQHVKDGVARIATEKSQFEISVAIPLPQELLATLAAGPCGDLAFITGSQGEPLTKESFGNFFREACRAAEIRKSAHGLRKLAATDAAESGFSNFEMDARFGWTGGQMAALYTRKANRERLSLEAERRKGEGRAPRSPYAS
jgi:integrase